MTGFARIGGLLAVLLIVAMPAPAFAEGSVDTTRNGGESEPGKVLSVASMRLVPALANVATGKRITYVSRDSDGRAIVVSGAVLTPRLTYLRNNPRGANKIVAWAHGTAGLADQCAPSGQPNLYPDPAYPNYADTVASYLTQGWTVTATDYPGLGTPGPHPYLIGDSEGRAVIDSVRAARNLNDSLSNVWVVSGHSQGGQAALFAGQLAGTYGAGLQLRGVVAIAPISNEDIIGPALAGTPLQGYLALAIFGLAAVDPTVHPQDILAPPALDRTGVLDTGCFNEVIAAYAPLTADEMLIGGVLPDSVIAKAATNNPGQQPNNAPVFLVQGDADQTVPLALTQLLLQQECAVNPYATQLTVYPGQDHDPVLYAAQADVVTYITARFANQPAPANCP
jgi:alpha-beta hydrolase superfamily lysophospholipase